MAGMQAIDGPTVVGSQLMRTTKISITIDTDLLDEIRAYAGGNLSGYINSVLRDQVRNARLRRLVEEYEATHGPIPAELMAQAKAEFEAAEAAWRDG
jgi:hypothetical protein